MTDSSTPIQVLIADLADELCDPRQHRERRHEWTPNRNRRPLPDHVTIQPGLLQQLHDAVIPAASAREDTGLRPAPRSAPPLQLDALAAYVEISIAASDWIDLLHLTQRGEVKANIRALAGANHAGHAQDLLADLRRWRGAAATLTGWQQVMRPRAWCPVIDCPAAEPGSLRVNLTNQTAFCVICRSWWDQTNIGVLAEHIAKTPTG